MSELATPLPHPVRDDALIARLRARRSAPAQGLSAPGPSDAELETILEIGLRSPDHGKLFPWRLVVIGPETRGRWVGELETLAASDKDRAVLRKLAAPPVTVMVVSAPVESPKVPRWEQELSAGVVCMNLEHAANAHGYAASWITDWYAYDPRARALMGVAEGETVAGFIHMGTAAEPLLERPRPEMADKVARLP
ncbi:MAG: nitroreductase [Alphaproteobacteria bacterium]|nr:nitroreductase [Alphaproteobacteria bacterium]MBU1526583.1 nitroreductase [Alphaproteobacteria bacterium]MBU2118157.1 nitroreductase [Alphaproteobacteria bacterium]MBU2351552.1 nitroreductase [Alphaproteobacteria bacterium]MBU2383169.1 nitroreductase [Alphaproteobacteria bacterium]